MKSKKEPQKIQATYSYKDKTEISEIPKDFTSLKAKIKELYHMDDAQLNNIQISYFDKEGKGENKIFIMEEKDFEKAKLLSEQIIFTIKDIPEKKDDTKEINAINDMNDEFIINEDRVMFLNPKIKNNVKKRKKGKLEILKMTIILLTC